MPPNPKRPAREVPIREEHILKADDPRPQRVPQYPSAGASARRTPKRAEEHIPTSVFDTEASDEEMQAQYGVPDAEFKQAFLYVERGPGAGQLLEVKQGTVVVGRASVSDLRLQHPSISRRHAHVKRQGEQFFVKDLGSQNGTFVNKQRIANEVEVKPGDTIAMGNALVRLRGPLEKGEKLTPIAAKSSTKARIETAVVARHTGSHPAASNALKIAVFAGAVGFGLAAALAFALVKTMSSKEPPVAAATSKASTTSGDERSRLIDEAIKRKMAEQAAEAKAAKANAPAPAEEATPVEAEVESDTAVVKVKTAQEPPKVAAAPVVRPAPVVAKASKPRPAAKAQASEEEEDEGDTEAAPAKASSPAAKRTQILAAYEKGNAEASLTAAKAAGDKDLTGKLEKFIMSYDAANDAMMANNGNAAIMNFQKALQLDEQLSSGWGKYGAEIRRQLSNLYVLVGLKFVSDGSADKAKQAFQAALKHDPNNQRAKAQLDKLGAAPKSPDDAFEESDSAEAAAPAPRKAVKPKAAASAIDDAFGD